MLQFSGVLTLFSVSTLVTLKESHIQTPTHTHTVYTYTHVYIASRLND